MVIVLKVAIWVLLLYSPAMQEPVYGIPLKGQDINGIKLKGNADTLDVIAIDISGNKVTRDRIILREIMFGAGQRISRDDLLSYMELSRQNLLNTSLFNFVDFSLETLPDDNVRVIVDVVERWYIWPIPIVKLGDRNFNVWWETKDFSRLSYGFYIDWRNFRGRRENLITRLQFGYDQLFDFYYTIPYLNNNQTLGLGFGAGFKGNHETAYITESNMQQFHREEDGYARQDIFAFAQVQFRKNIYNTHLIELRFDHLIFSDSLVQKNPFYTLEGQTRLDYLSFHYKFKSDHRDFAPYPLIGYYVDAEFYKYGFGFEGENAPDYFSLRATFRKFWKLAPKLYYALGVNGKYSPDKRQPYFLVNAIGYGRDIIRSYEYYVIDGNSFGIFKSNLKLAIISQRNAEIGFIRTEKFSRIFFALYSNLFIDMGYVYNPHQRTELDNTLENEFLLGFGAGIDFVTYYDIVLRFEYSVNRMWEHGFFIHFNAPI
jgi:outer membrane protein assembly factor BamA